MATKTILPCELRIGRTFITYQRITFKSCNAYSKQVVGEQGIETHFPKIKTPTSVIPYGFDTDFWKYDQHEQRTNQFITVVHALQFARRDIGLLFELFKKNSDWQLTLIGSLPISVQIPKNVKVED